ncbi:MAG: hypothetical protein WCH01_11630 [Methylococcaceae bacterium]|jgi:hypothetical protein
MKVKLEVVKDSVFCEWRRFVGEWDFETGCHNYFETVEGATLDEVNFQYCPFCGRKIKEQVLMSSLDVT